MHRRRHPRAHAEPLPRSLARIFARERLLALVAYRRHGSTHFRKSQCTWGGTTRPPVAGSGGRKQRRTRCANARLDTRFTGSPLSTRSHQTSDIGHTVAVDVHRNRYPLARIIFDLALDVLLAFSATNDVVLTCAVFIINIFLKSILVLRSAPTRYERDNRSDRCETGS